MFDAAATAHVTEDGSNGADLQSNKNCEKETSKPDTQDLKVYTEEICPDIAYGNNISHLVRHAQV